MPEEINFLPLSPTDGTELFRLIGRALWACSFLEHQIVHHTILVFTGPYKSIAEVEVALEKSFEQTLGNMLREFRKYCELAPDLDKKFDDFKKERDWLCQAIYWQGHISLYRRDRLQELFQRLQRLYDEAKELADILDRNFDIWLVKKGVTQEESYARARKMIEEWKQG